MTLNINNSVDSFPAPSTYKRISFSRSRSSVSQLESNFTTTSVDGLSVKVPKCLVQCFDYLQSNGMVEGIFRVNGSVKRISQYFSNHNVENWIAANPSPHDISGVIKKYLNYYLYETSVFDGETTKEIKSHYNEYLNQILVIDHNDDASINSFKTAKTSYDCNPLNEFVEKVVQSMISERSQDKNQLFIYIVYNLSLIMEHSVKTKMSSINLAIIFQPYFFDNSDINNIQALPFLQEILQTLIENSHVLINEYSIEVANLHDNNSLMSIDSPITHHGNSTDTYIETESSPVRKRSISNRFSTLLDSYYSPIGNTATGKPKRFSLSISVDQLSNSKPAELKPIDPKSVDVKSISMNDISDATGYSTTNSTNPVKPELKSKKSNRKSFIALFRNSSSFSINSDDTKDPIYNHLNNSADSVLIAKNPIVHDQQNFLKRNFSMKMKSKKL
ncbi:uncharacterized protein AC631_00311 [Debaryomyces fabryi]|uniref:Rho-GAP domain-containing protein n=1 Tax=Debaryomyces fabryi TaxID=58627 RepID=A0A0V1Q5T3_9ASCO|nr:uncharacterized protein AC631_00311 [Debaryomyces fabryi]KSA03856.1 hypothetical protein AC631_00311 [Debaryomyces fabryi]CUM48673.1 unnamed protein product [Debaryomyces fabryi]